MKKTMLLCWLLLVTLCMCACGNTEESSNRRFSGSSELAQYLNGMWKVENNNSESTYYIFQDGQVYKITDSMYSSQVKDMLDRTRKNGGLEALYIQTFESISERMYLSDFSAVTEDITWFPETGEVKLYAGMHNEERISVTEDAVFLKTNSAAVAAELVKCADTADFSMEHFASLFTETLDSYPISTSNFWMSPREYGEIVKKLIPNFNWWVIRDADLYGTVYEPNAALTAITGSSLTITDTSVLLVYELNLSTWDNQTEMIILEYNPSDRSFSVKDYHNPSLDMLKWVAYGGTAVESFPGFPKDLQEFYDTIESAESSFSSGMNVKELTLNGLTYTLGTSADGTSGQFTIKCDKTIPLGDLLEANKTQAPSAPSRTMEQLLDGSKSWVAQWEYEDWEYNIHFVFKEDGTCYFALSELELFDAGVGTYTVQSGNTITVALMMSGKLCNATYTFDPDNFSLTIVSEKGIVGEKGEIFLLQESAEHDAEMVQGWGELMAEGISDEGEDLLWG